MAVGKWVVTRKAKEYLMDGTIDLDATATNSWKVVLLASGFSTNAATAIRAVDLFATALVATDLAANASTGANEYFTATAGSWPNASGDTMRFIPGGTVSWTATGGTLAPAWAVLYNDAQTSPVDPVVAFCDLVTEGVGSLSITVGNTLQISLPTSGLFTLTGATDPAS
jgi:hypothetical protein